MTSAPASMRAALAAFVPPEVRWVHGDDLCDCTFQIMGDWTNPYLGKTMRVRLCCIYGELFKEYPQFVEHIDAYYDENLDAYIPVPMEWDADYDMPVHIWHRQVAFREGITLQEARDRCRGKEPPKAVKNGRKLEVNGGATEGTAHRVRASETRRRVRKTVLPRSHPLIPRGDR